MGRLKLANIDKRIMRHIQYGGTTSDPVGREIIGRLVLEAFKDPEIKMASIRTNVDANELCQMYAEMVDSLLPNPLIEAGGPMLAATLPFIEKHRITTMMSQFSKKVEGLSPEDRNYVLKEYAEGNARLIWETHANARGVPRFEILPGSGIQKTSGCMSAVLFVLATVGSLIILC